ncbi:Hypothetical protein CulFRC58_0486 [Corynebacterium ulcerans FRC58]|uniref:Transposase n=1 Tax=Corynebacterium ulcerans FRC58 TaxID=1408268 RepID=A0ABM5U045_CORUL|nr:Hypothetical protein CulFRC58_0486 [Corynebacterium ulcerans FRC58]
MQDLTLSDVGYYLFRLGWSFRGSSLLREKVGCLTYCQLEAALLILFLLLVFPRKGGKLVG